MDIFKTPIGRYAPGIINVVIEIPKGDRKRFRYHRKRRTFVVDYRLMTGPPGEFGWIPQTWTKGGKRLNAIVLAQKPTWAGHVCEARPIGGLRRQDGDHQIVCALLSDPSAGNCQDVSDLDDATMRRLIQFYEPFFPLKGWMNRAEALEYVREANDLYKKQPKASHQKKKEKAPKPSPKKPPEEQPEEQPEEREEPAESETEPEAESETEPEAESETEPETESETEPETEENDPDHA